MKRFPRARRRLGMLAAAVLLTVGVAVPVSAQAAPSAYSAFDLRLEGAPLAGAGIGIQSEPHREDGGLGSTDANGFLSLAGIGRLAAPQSVLVSLYRHVGDRWQTSWWNGTTFSTDRAAATPITLVADGGATLRVDMDRPTGGISGSATVDGGPGVMQMSIQVTSVATRDWVTTLQRDEAGAYELAGLDDGRYLVQFFAGSRFSAEFPWPYEYRWYRDSRTPGGAEVVTIAQGEVVEHIDQVLPYGSPLQPNPVETLAGTDRFHTSALLSQSSFDPGVPVVYVTNGLKFPDALSAAPVAYANDGPVLLVAPTQLTANVVTELTRLAPQRIVILGDAQSVSAGVEQQLADFTEGTVTRIAGADRFATSAALSREAFPEDVERVYIANGLNFPDALSAAAVAGPAGAPILLVTPTGIPAVIATELERLNPEQIVVLGDPNAVSSVIEAQLAGFARDAVTRIAGINRFETSARISQDAFPTGASTVYISNGHNFPDALAAASVAGRENAPILLVSPGFIPESTGVELARLRPERIVVLGGEIDRSMPLQLRDYLQH